MFTKFWNDLRDYSTVQCPHPIVCVFFVQKIFAIRSRSRVKIEQMYMFVGPQFLVRDEPNFSIAIVNAMYCPPFGKVWLSSDC